MRTRESPLQLEVEIAALLEGAPDGRVDPVPFLRRGIEACAAQGDTSLNPCAALAAAIKLGQKFGAASDALVQADRALADHFVSRLAPSAEGALNKLALENDVLNLSELTPPAMLASLSRRFLAEVVYTYVGDVIKAHSTQTQQLILASPLTLQSLRVTTDRRLGQPVQASRLRGRATDAALRPCQAARAAAAPVRTHG